MSDRRRSKLEVFVAAIGIAVVLAGVLFASTSRSEAIVALEYLVLCHYQPQTEVYLQVVGNGHLNHKEDLVLPPKSQCPVASPSR